MALTYGKVQGRSDIGRYIAIPHSAMNHPDWLGLTPNAIKLLIELMKQYNSKNNGDLTAAWSFMKKRGFKSQTTLSAALKCLLLQNYITQTRDSQFRNPGKRCALYAVNWYPINECLGKNLNVNATASPPRAFSLEIKMLSTKNGTAGSKK